jgi:hypothetical protein
VDLSDDRIIITGSSRGVEENATWYACTIKYNSAGEEVWDEPATYESTYTYERGGEYVDTGNGSKKVFMLNYHPVVPDSEIIYLNDVEQVRDEDYTIDYATGKITFTTAPGAGVKITADYTVLTGISAFGAAVDSEGDIIIAGSYYIPGNYLKPVTTGYIVVLEIHSCYLTIKYDSDGNIVEGWPVIYAATGHQECAYDVAVDKSDNSIIVTGKALESEDANWEYLTIKYDSAGDEVWNMPYSNEFGAGALDVAVDSESNVIVTGWSSDGENLDYCTIKYDENGGVVTGWPVFYNGGHGDTAYGVAVDSEGSIIVTGCSQIYKGAGGGGGFPPGAIAGIVIGSCVVGGGVSYYLIKRRRKPVGRGEVRRVARKKAKKARKKAKK